MNNYGEKIDIIVDRIDLNAIIILLQPGVKKITKNDMSILLNGSEFIDYYIFDKSKGLGTIYEIIPYEAFAPYDDLEMQIIKNEFVSDKIKIFFAKRFHDGSIEVEMKLPQNIQGKYMIRLLTVNGRFFNICSDYIIASKLIDKNKSTAVLEGSGVYNVNENINVEIQLYDIDGNKVPDGNYRIKIELIIML
ncbi:hypothetical protein CLTEP_16480 [Clostridium tepidiprofundi DSM 19306]|uniref:Uncharacterized protein n=1 Tax=Clostridium tepidiprofundi DSM 19306 TaxID=1121338 RepID=A0A151B3D1_9CLOT|nr:hypothetical protein [Clostridium tepidiprofundi]KYH34415.1 hypothetical protein CLTEP_16480 [Clostridium tepidiprofundi DSM 19306]